MNIRLITGKEKDAYFLINDDFIQYYKMVQKNEILAILGAYDNQFHSFNKYINPVKICREDNVKEVFKILLKYFNKPLQVMCPSTKLEEIRLLENAGFVCVRRCFEREIKSIDLKEKTEVEALTTELGSNVYNDICDYALQYYKITHEKINPYSGDYEDFIEELPKNVFFQIKNDKIINYVFVQNNELCHFGSNDLSSFQDFMFSVTKKVLKKYDSVIFEVNDTDEVAMAFKQIFEDNSRESFNTYVLSKDERKI